MTTRDKGVNPGLLDRHFGNAGYAGTDGRPKKTRSAIMREKAQAKKRDARNLDAMKASLPKKPPSSNSFGK